MPIKPIINHQSLTVRPKPRKDRSDGQSKGEKIHRKLCLVCIAETERPGFEQEIFEMYMRWQSAHDIEEMIGYRTETRPVLNSRGFERTDKKGNIIYERVQLPIIPEKSILRHALFFGWQQKRQADLGNTLRTIIDVGMNAVMRKYDVSDKLLATAIDMKNKMDGSYYKPKRNPRDQREQLRATVEAIYSRHKQLAEKNQEPLDITHEEIIESLSTRPGYESIKILLRDERWREE